MIGIYDVHSHLLAGVDDGAKSRKMTSKLLREEYRQGVRTIFVTPHYRRGMFETPMDVIDAEFAWLQEEAADIAPDLRVVLGCEFHACMDMVSLLQQGERPALGYSRCVLIEFSDRHDFRMMQERVYALLSAGYVPIIAHAERYSALYGYTERLEELIDMGAYIQMNADSVLGLAGWRMKWFCRRVMKRDLLHLIGSDAHDMGKRAPHMKWCADYVTKVMGRRYAKKIFVGNPRRIIEKGNRR